jgi:hypothetical protein
VAAVDTLEAFLRALRARFPDGDAAAGETEGSSQAPTPGRQAARQAPASAPAP